MVDHVPPTKVLLVDDDRLVHEILHLLLKGTQFSLVSASSVAEAVQSISAELPDIIITDAMMPGESGFSLIERVRKSPETRHIPIILMTILEDMDGSVMDASRKADFAVTKPVYSSNIVSRLEDARSLMEERRMVKALAASSGDAVRVVL